MTIERSAVVLADGRLVRWRSGGVAHVDFDWAWVLKREETKGDVAGFFHTHPPGIRSMSGRDRRTMEAWAVSFGKRLLCTIRCGKETRAWWCDPRGGVKETEVCLSKRILKWTR